MRFKLHGETNGGICRTVNAMEPPPAKKWVKTPEEKRNAARRLIESGVSFHDVSHGQGIPVDTLRSWARRGSWLTPGKLQRKAKVARAEVLRELETPPRTAQPEPEKPQLPSISHPQLAQLLTLAQNGPPEFVKSATAYLQTLLAENANVIEINNLRDWKEVWGMWRQGAGLDKQAAGGNGTSPLVNPIRTVSRRSGPVIDAEPIPETAPLDDWEP